ncbi:unnamed protein product, partial [Pylaiella littoralis]
MGPPQGLFVVFGSQEAGNRQENTDWKEEGRVTEGRSSGRNAGRRPWAKTKKTLGRKTVAGKDATSAPMYSFPESSGSFDDRSSSSAVGNKKWRRGRHHHHQPSHSSVKLYSFSIVGQGLMVISVDPDSFLFCVMWR